MQPGSRVLVSLDIHTSIPEGYMITLHIRSGVALKDGLILQKVETCEWEEVDNLEDLDVTNRGIGGFGSTGKQ